MVWHWKWGQMGVHSLPLFNLHGEYIMWKSNLDDTEDGVRIGGRDMLTDATLSAESKEDLMKLLQLVKKESEKASLYLNLNNTDFFFSDWETLTWKWWKV